jgi:hypothetical protein
MWYGVLADVVAAIHAAYVAFVVLGLIAILAGRAMGRRWVRDPLFRLLHLAAILFVFAETVLGIDCPLTTLENALRLRAGETAYPGQFIGYWMDKLIFYNFPIWVFTVLYFAVSVTIVAMLWLVPIEFTKPSRLSPTDW